MSGRRDADRSTSLSDNDDDNDDDGPTTTTQDEFCDQSPDVASVVAKSCHLSGENSGRHGHG